MTKTPDLRRASDTEVLAALLGPVSPESVDRARQLLAHVGGYPNFTRSSVRELMVAEGVGPATATRIHAAIEAGRRALTTPLDRGTPFTSAAQVHKLFAPRFADADVPSLPATPRFTGTFLTNDPATAPPHTLH